MDIIVVGSSIVDLISNVNKLPQPGETVEGISFQTGLGGKGANQCVSASRLGAKTLFVSRLGDDVFGERYRNYFDSDIDIRFLITTKDAATGIAIISVDEKGENSIIINVGANAMLSVQDVQSAETDIEMSKIMICQFEIPEESTKAALTIARQHGVITILNAAPAKKDLDPIFLELSDIFCVNETEAEATNGCPVNSVGDAKTVAKSILTSGPRCVIITLGSKGAVLATVDQVTHVSTDAVSAIDTTGAGDSFVGALAYFLSRRKEGCLKKVIDDHKIMRSLIEKACKVASYSVQRPGTQSSYPRRSDLPDSLFDN